MAVATDSVSDVATSPLRSSTFAAFAPRLDADALAAGATAAVLVDASDVDDVDGDGDDCVRVRRPIRRLRSPFVTATTAAAAAAAAIAIAIANGSERRAPKRTRRGRATKRVGRER